MENDVVIKIGEIRTVVIHENRSIKYCWAEAEHNGSHIYELLVWKTACVATSMIRYKVRIMENCSMESLFLKCSIYEKTLQINIILNLEPAPVSAGMPQRPCSCLATPKTECPSISPKKERAQELQSYQVDTFARAASRLHQHYDWPRQEYRDKKVWKSWHDPASRPELQIGTPMPHSPGSTTVFPPN